MLVDLHDSDLDVMHDSIDAYFDRADELMDITAISCSAMVGFILVAFYWYPAFTETVMAVGGAILWALVAGVCILKLSEFQ